MDDVKWREIPLVDINWKLTGCTGHVASHLYSHSREPHDPRWPQGHQWAGWTLGELADMGEREWVRASGIGTVAVAVIKEVIDRAAAGEDVTKAGTEAHSYQPQPWPRESGSK